MEFYDFPFSWECHHPNSLSLTFFPTSLCGVLVFGCALPPASRLHAPPPTHNLFSTHNLSTHNLLTQLHRPSLCMAGVGLGDIDLHFAWQAWHLWPWTGSGGALGCFGRRGCLRGRHGTWRHRPSLCVAGMALMALDWLWWHTKLFHTTLSQIPFTHNFVRQAFHTQLCHTQLFHTQLCHTQIFHTQLFHTQLCHIHLFHTQSFTHNFVTYNSFTHNTFTYTNLHTQHCHTQLFHPTCLAPSPFLPAFPISFSHLLVIVGRSWFVGLSGPLFQLVLTWIMIDVGFTCQSQVCHKLARVRKKRTCSDAEFGNMNLPSSESEQTGQRYALQTEGLWWWRLRIRDSSCFRAQSIFWHCDKDGADFDSLFSSRFRHPGTPFLGPRVALIVFILQNDLENWSQNKM